MPDTLVQIADIAKKQQDSAKALWNAKYRQPVPANTLFVDCPAMRANPFRPYFLSAIAAAIAGCRQ